MKRNLITICSIMVLFLFVWTAFAQRPERPSRPPMVGPGGPGQNLSEQEREQLRQRWQNMSEEERERLRDEMRERFGSGRGRFMSPEEQLKAINAIQEQLDKLKTVVESSSPEDWRRLRDLPEEERQQLRNKLEKESEQRQQALSDIVAQIAKLQGQRLAAENEEYLIINVDDLRRIQEIADREKAEQTSRDIDRLIRRRQRSFEYRMPGDRPERPGRRRPELQRERDRQEEPAVSIDSSVKKAPQFTLSSFDGKQVRLSDYKGKIVVLEWLNVECPFVRYHYDTASTMIDLANKYRDKNVVWLAINSTSHTTDQDNIEFARKHNLPYMILDDRSGKVGHEYGATNTPDMYVIDTDGNIVYFGAIDNSPMGNPPEGQSKVNYVDKALEELLAGKTVSTMETKPYGCTVKYAN
jgi:peroxiredoxin